MYKLSFNLCLSSFVFLYSPNREILCKTLYVRALNIPSVLVLWRCSHCESHSWLCCAISTISSSQSHFNIVYVGARAARQKFMKIVTQLSFRPSEYLSYQKTFVDDRATQDGGENCAAKILARVGTTVQRFGGAGCDWPVMNAEPWAILSCVPKYFLVKIVDSSLRQFPLP